MLARNQLIMFSGRFCKKNTQNSDINYGDYRTPDKGSTRNFNERNYSFYHSWRPF